MDNIQNLDVDVQKLKFSTFNISGLKNGLKLHAVFNSLKSLKLNIIALQETHLDKDNIDILNSIWQGPFIYSEGTNHSKGLCILFDTQFSDNQIEVLLKTDRILLCSCKVGAETLYLCNIYAPNGSKEKILFFNNLKRNLNNKIANINVKKLVVLGDFNCVLSNKLDIISGRPHPVDTVKSLNLCIEENELTDVWRKNYPKMKDYTWIRNNISRRLDYVFASNFILPLITGCEIRSIGHSDHRAVVCNIEFNKFKRGKGTYKMNASLFDNMNFKNSIKKLINNNMDELKDLDPILKWEAIKIKIREQTQLFGKYNKFKNKEETYTLTNRLTQLETELAQDIDNTEKQREVEHIKTKLEIKNIEITKAAKIRSKIQWIEDGEKCSKYFLALEKHNGVQNTVFNIKDKFGEIKTMGKDIVAVFADHFSHVYANNVEEDNIQNNMEEFLNNVNLKSLTNIEKDNLEKEITVEELYSALKTLNKSASPGIDGFCIEFYLIFFDEIKLCLLDFYEACFQQGKLSKNSQQGLITLLHKGKGLNRNEVSNWRPITLSNVDYKIIAKLLANRLKGVISNLVGHQQQGFIKGRNISNIIRGIDDVIEYEKNSKLKDFLFIIDFKQAFDKINTTYICLVFEKFGFGENFIWWLKTLFDNRYSCVKNGGHLSDFFPVESGVKQGCPIAPLLFVLAAEILAQNIIQDDNIKGVKYPGSSAHLKIQRFADDTSFFCKSIIDIREILSRLKAFSIFSGLVINIKKCAIMPLGINSFLLNDLIENIKLTNEAKIVGIIFKKDKCASEIEENWKGRIEKIKTLIKGWMKRKLTVIGKIQVIKTFLLSQFVFILQSLAVPRAVLDDINSILYRFIWRKDNIDKRGWERVSRKILSNEKEKGGLRMINMHEFQNSFLLTWAKSLFSNETQDWKLFPNHSLKSIGGVSIFRSQITFNDIKGKEDIKSVFWKRVLQVWLEQDISIKRCTKYDPIFNNMLMTVSRRPIFVNAAIEQDIFQIKDMLNENFEIISFAEYNQKVGMNAANFLDYTSIQAVVTKALSKIENGENDNILFLKGKDIITLNRKKLFQLILKEDICHCEKLWEKKLGKKLNESTWSNIFDCTKETKLQEFQWKVVHNIFPTNILLNRMGIEPSEKCEYCGVTDYVEHLFFECKRIGKFWEKVERLIKERIGKNISLTKYSIILGIEQDDNFRNLISNEVCAINRLLIIAKLSISKSRKEKKNVDIVFEGELNIREMHLD